MKHFTAFDDLGKRANRFSRPVAIFFTLLGVGSLTLGYGFQNVFQKSPNENALAIADSSPFNQAIDLNQTDINGNDIAATELASDAAATPTIQPASQQVVENNSGVPQINKSELSKFIRGDSFGKALIRGGVPPAEAFLATHEARKVFPLASLGQNQVVKLDFGKNIDNKQFLKQFSVRVGDETELLVKRLESGNYEAALNQLTVDNLVKLYRFKINKTGSLASSAEVAGLSRSQSQNLADLLGLDINLQTDIRPNDLIQLLFDESTTAIKDEIGGNLRVVLISSPKSRKDNAFFYYVDETGTVGYYNKDGKSQRKMLLATPVDGARLISKFGLRMHPVLGYTRAHKGIDFAAPIGTRVKASGDGVVTIAKWQTGYGNYLRIRHRNGYSTAYAHLSRYEKGITVGSRVRQGETVAYVGNTGLSTGPHLHYEILINNDQVNPSTVKLPSLRALSGNDLTRFELVKKDALLRIQNAQIMVKK
ncbi:MAG: M23 family metallopeptidase [Alphaproteobacteria bacterium]